MRDGVKGGFCWEGEGKGDGEGGVMMCLGMESRGVWQSEIVFNRQMADWGDQSWAEMLSPTAACFAQGGWA
jgi:hypothetical protein